MGFSMPPKEFMEPVYTPEALLSMDAYSLLCSKSRVAPLKMQTILRLEICAAVLLAELMDKVKNVFQNPSGTIYYWSDSKIALTWIAKPSHTWKTFVVFCKNSGVD